MKRYLILSIALSMTGCAWANSEEEKKETQYEAATEAFEAQDFSHLLGMPGFSDKALEMHFTLYQGYVKNANFLLERLKELGHEEKLNTPEYNEFKRRLMWEYDGMRLHELYFSNLGGEGSELDANSPLHIELVGQFGSIEAWKDDFIATGALRGIGWSILYRDPLTGRLVNTWIDEHDTGHMAGGSPLLIMDVWEHAYMTDYGIDRKAYMEAFYKNINWPLVEERFSQHHIVK
jgi:superoxide dismutase, Fe-Mn family